MELVGSQGLSSFRVGQLSWVSMRLWGVVVPGRASSAQETETGLVFRQGYLGPARRSVLL